jgi:hypothetical protein
VLYRTLADVVAILHLVFILFVIFGALFVLKWIRTAWLHVPVVAWAALIEFNRWICPLTPLESWLRMQAGGTGYTTSFTERYIFPVVYPAELTYRIQIILGLMVLVINVTLYAWIFRRRIRGRS